MNKYKVRIIPTEGEVIDSVLEGESEDEIRSRLMAISDFRKSNGEPTIMYLNISEIKE